MEDAPPSPIAIPTQAAAITAALHTLADALAAVSHLDDPTWFMALDKAYGQVVTARRGATRKRGRGEADEEPSVKRARVDEALA